MERKRLWYNGHNGHSIYIVGYVCDALSLDPQYRCCPERGDKFPCQWVFLPYGLHDIDLDIPLWCLVTPLVLICSGCNVLSQCCNSYEFCVSCCLHPARVSFSTTFFLLVIIHMLGIINLVLDFFCRHKRSKFWN